MPRKSFSSARSLTRSATAAINRSCGIASKQLAMSVSTTQRRPRQHSSMSTCRASCTLRLGRKPNEQGRKSASNTGSRTIFAAVCTTRSRTVGTVPSYCDPFRVVCGFDIFGQLVGAGDAGMTGCLELRGEVDPAAAGLAAAGRQVAAAGPVVDDVGLDGEPVGDLGDGQLAVSPHVHREADGVDRRPGELSIAEVAGPAVDAVGL